MTLCVTNDLGALHVFPRDHSGTIVFSVLGILLSTQLSIRHSNTPIQHILFLLLQRF